MLKKKVRKEKEDEVIEGEVVRKVWDLKKIIIGFIILITVLILASYLFTPRYAGESESRSFDAQDVPPLPDAEDIDKIINNAQDALSNISSENLTSSQAAIQKVINDLQKLQGDGVGGAICSLVCGE